MTSTIITKNSSTASSVPSSGSLTQGELAVNVTDKKLYTKDSGGTVVKLVGSLGNQEASAAAITGGSINGTTVGASTASTGAFTTLSASSTVSGTGFSTYLASPPAIGGTAAAAGSFTTLSASGAVTLSGGTANGVPYLNGSKVVTSGSSLVFDGTNLGVGTTTTNAKLTVKQDAADGLFIKSADSNFSSLSLGIAVSSGITYLQSTNSGTGGQLPFAFYIGGSEQMRLTSTGLGIGTSSPSNKLSIGGRLDFVSYSTHQDNWGIWANSTDGLTLSSYSVYPMVFRIGNAEKMRLDSSGNLGLGVTPSAWNSSFRTMQLGNSGYIFGRASQTQMEMGNNAVFDATDTRWEYITTNTAQRYLQDGSSGSHQWFTAPSGTAGNAITFSQAMTLDASGNLAIGTTSAGDRLTVSGGRIRMDQDYQIVWQNAGTNRARIYGDSGNNILFENGSGNTERARIDSSGALLVGTTTTNRGSSGFHVVNNGQFFSSTDSATNLNLRKLVSNGDAATFTATSGSIVGAITIGATTTTYNTSSDYRLKNTIAPMTGALAKVALLKPCTYKWNADGSDGEGFIAHELAEVVPQCVTGEKDAVDEDGNPKYQGIDTSFLVATLTAALQEAVAEINSLKARLDAANL